MDNVGIIGGGAQAKELADYLTKASVKVLFYAVNSQYVDRSDNKSLDIANLNLNQIETPILLGVGAPAIKRRLAESWQGKNIATYKDRSSYISPLAVIGDGAVVCPNATISSNVELGNHVLINIGATISHDVKIGDYSTIGPGVNIAGRVKVGKGVFIGIGAVVKNDIFIAEGTVIGAGAVVIKDIQQENSVVVGNPAKTIKVNEDWLSEI